MIGVIWSLLTGNPIARALAKVGGVILGVLTMRAIWKRDGRKEERAAQAEAALDATVKGQEAARKGRAEAYEKMKQGKTPEQIVRENDNAWR